MKLIKTGRMVKRTDCNDFIWWSNRRWDFCDESLRKYFDIPGGVNGVFLELHRYIPSVIKSLRRCNTESCDVRDYFCEISLIEGGEIFISNYQDASPIINLESIEHSTFKFLEKAMGLGVKHYVICLYE